MKDVHVTAGLLISPLDASCARSVLRHSDRWTIGVYSQFMRDGWNEISDDASAAFSLRLCERLQSESASASGDCGRLAEATFAEVAGRFKSDFPEWTRCEFAALILGSDRASLHWVGDVHGVIQIGGGAVATVDSHVAIRTTVSGQTMNVVTNYLSLTSGASVETKSVELPPPGGNVFAFIGSAPLTEILESDLCRMLASTPTDVCAAEMDGVVVTQLHGVCLSY